jgi:formate hydrogenlyase transcriptional activator
METAVVSIANARSFGLGGMIGASQELRHLWYLVQMVAKTDSAVLIQGETGTGKELLAKAIHDESLRCRGPFVKVNCAAIPAGLLESELFGHERGAFTGALNQTTGRFERAHTGTLFLDEIGDLPLELQPKLLRVLQEKEFERLGSSHTIHVNIRFVAATNQDLLRMVQEGRFRADLFYRLNVFPIGIPALRDRKADIAPLAYHFVERCASRLGKAVTNIPGETMEILQKHDWPGNIRELQNLIERAVIMSPGCDLRVPPMEKRLVTQPCFTLQAGTLVEAERDHIVRVLDEVGGTIGGPYGAASRLGIPRTSLIYKMRKLGIKQKRTKPCINSVSRNQCVKHAMPAASL